jgi:hypothetical protein
MKNYALVYQIVKLLILISIVSSCDSKGIEVTIENHDNVAIDSLELNVTGNKYFLGSIKPKETKSTKISVTGESHIDLYHSSNKKLFVDVYLESGYRGSIHIDITADSVLNTVSEIKLVP